MRSGTQEMLLRGLEAQSLDIVLTNLIPPRDASSPYLVHHVAEQPVSLVGTPERLPGGETDAASILASEPLVLPTPETSLRAGLDALLERLGIVPRIAAEADDMAMLRLLARADAGVAVIPPIVVQDELEAGRLKEYARLDDVREVFVVVTIARKFPNPLVHEVLRSE